MMADKKIRSVAKTFSWRLFIFIYWVIFGYIYTGTFVGAGILGFGSIIPLFFTLYPACHFPQFSFPISQNLIFKFLLMLASYTQLAAYSAALLTLSFSSSISE